MVLVNLIDKDGFLIKALVMGSAKAKRMADKFGDKAIPNFDGGFDIFVED